MCLFWHPHHKSNPGAYIPVASIRIPASCAELKCKATLGLVVPIPTFPCEVMWKTVVVPVGVDELTEKSGVVGAVAAPAMESFAHGDVVPMPTLPPSGMIDRSSPYRANKLRMTPARPTNQLSGRT